MCKTNINSLKGVFNLNIKDKKENLTKDELLVDYIKDQLEEKMQASSMDINVTCRDGVVHLSGFVDVLAEKKYAEQIAYNIDGVRKVENNITIGVEGQITDKHIEKEVIDKLRNNSYSEKINGVGVKVKDGVVNLVGHVDTLKDSHIAMKLASEVRGVKDVVNNTQISTLGVIDDITINNMIRDKLNRADFSGEDITCTVTGGIASLSGYAQTRRDAEIAKELAMSVEGVRKVINKIRIREK